MSDATGTGATHPALVTVVGAPAPGSGPDATGTGARHPAVVTKPGGAAESAGS